MPETALLRPQWSELVLCVCVEHFYFKEFQVDKTLSLQRANIPFCQVCDGN